MKYIRVKLFVLSTQGKADNKLCVLLAYLSIAVYLCIWNAADESLVDIQRMAKSFEAKLLKATETKTFSSILFFEFHFSSNSYSIIIP